jgi:hypothetical protein
MNTLYRPSATAALFVAAALVACHGVGDGGYTPSVSQEVAPGAAQLPVGPAGIVCKSPKVGPGTYLLYDAAGNVKGTTFTELPAKSGGGGGWDVFKYVKVKPTPTPKPSPTPKPIALYAYYGTFATANHFKGCALLFTTVSGKPIFKGETFNADTDGAPYLKPGSYSLRNVAFGLISSLTISHLSASGGSGSGKFVTVKGKPYTTVSIALTGRAQIKGQGELRDFLDSLSTNR